MQTTMYKRYASFGGIDKVLSAYSAGRVTLRGVGARVGVSSTTVSKDLKESFGEEALQKAHNERDCAVLKNRQIRTINNGLALKLPYDTAVAYLTEGSLKQKEPSPKFKTIINLVMSATGKPTWVCFSANRISRVEGPKGTVIIRYAEPKKDIAEYKINRYRFKITPAQVRKAKVFLFCLMAERRISYYIFPSVKINKIQSLNLKFDKHENSKYASFLAKVESVK